MPAPETINKQAANWLIRLNETDADERLHEQFEHWKSLDPRHAAAAERLQGFVGKMSALRPQKTSVQRALDASFGVQDKPYRSRRAISALLLLCVLSLPGWFAWRSGVPGYLLADLRTEPAQWVQQRLPDNSLITLSGNSAVDLRFDESGRRIHLLRGELMVDVAHDPQRPFVVVTDQGQMRALGTRFVVTHGDDSTLLTMLESRVAASAGDRLEQVEVGAGQQARITHDGVQLLASVDTRSVEDAWRFHQLVVRDQPLPQVLEQLARQFPGHVRYDAAALADLRISAVLPLDDSARAFNLIAEALPVQVRDFTPWLKVVSRVESAPK